MTPESLETAESDALPYEPPSRAGLTTQILVTVTHRRPIPHLASEIAARAWNIDGVTSTDAVQQGGAS